MARAAVMVGCSTPYLCEIENGIAIPSYRLARKLEAKLRIRGSGLVVACVLELVDRWRGAGKRRRA